jgi:hypothetical protein
MPAQPFLDWLNRVDLTSAELKLEDLRLEPTIYLLSGERYRGRGKRVFERVLPGDF